jgi:uncharacterized protein YcbX
VVGTDLLDVRSVGFTPVKGTRHVRQAAPQVDADGPVGDRLYCLVDTERRRVLKTVENPGLLAVVARRSGPLLSLTTPDGSSVHAAPERSGETLVCGYWGRPVDLALLDGPHAGLLSERLGRPVRLALAPRGGVVYGSPVTIVATASLRDLGERAGHPRLVAEASRFRATYLVGTDVPYVEETWLGREMVADGVRLRIGPPVPRCAVVDLDPETGRRRGGLLKALAAYRPGNTAGEPHFGVYARVVADSAR